MNDSLETRANYKGNDTKLFLCKCNINLEDKNIFSKYFKLIIKMSEQFFHNTSSYVACSASSKVLPVTWPPYMGELGNSNPFTSRLVILTRYFGKYRVWVCQVFKKWKINNKLVLLGRNVHFKNKSTLFNFGSGKLRPFDQEGGI